MSGSLSFRLRMTGWLEQLELGPQSESVGGQVGYVRNVAGPAHRTRARHARRACTASTAANCNGTSKLPKLA